MTSVSTLCFDVTVDREVGGGMFVDRPFVGWPVSGSRREMLVTMTMTMIMMMTMPRMARMAMLRRFEERGAWRVKIASMERPVKRK